MHILKYIIVFTKVIYKWCSLEVVESVVPYCRGQLSGAVAGVLGPGGEWTASAGPLLPIGRESAAGPGGHPAQASSTCSSNSTSDPTVEAPRKQVEKMSKGWICVQ